MSDEHMTEQAQCGLLTDDELAQVAGGSGDMPDGDPNTAGKASPKLML